MTYPFHNRIHIILLFLTILCRSSTSQKPNVITSDLIRSICPKARNPTVCSEKLKGLIGTSLDKADVQLVSDAQVPGGVAIFKFTPTGDLIIKDPVMYRRYMSCLANYNNAVLIDLIEAQRILSSKTGYKNLSSEVSAAIKEAETCDKTFEQPPKLDPSIKELTEKFQDISSIAFLISDILTR